MFQVVIELLHFPTAQHQPSSVKGCSHLISAGCFPCKELAVSCRAQQQGSTRLHPSMSASIGMSGHVDTWLARHLDTKPACSFAAMDLETHGRVEGGKPAICPPLWTAWGQSHPFFTRRATWVRVTPVQTCPLPVVILRSCQNILRQPGCGSTSRTEKSLRGLRNE